METTTVLLDRLRARHPHAPELHQAVGEVARSLGPLRHAHPAWRERRVFERLIEPDRVIAFRVEWEDDTGQLHLERGYRVQQSNLLGPYKGGLRFVDGLRLGTLRFLAFEQVFKDALTGLPLGGAKGGSTFDPRDKSEREIMRFCTAFMRELERYIGPDLDVPAGDIGVGTRELGYLYGAYRRSRLSGAGALTGKEFAWGGIPLRPEATGYGLVYFLRAALAHHGKDLSGLRCAVSGAGNVATHAARKLMELGACVITLSNRDGTLVAPHGIPQQLLADITEAGPHGLRLDDFAERTSGVRFERDIKPWAIPCDVALPCATQNELGADDARALVNRGDVIAVAEGANMPCTEAAIETLRTANVMHLPGKAANAGGVLVSGLEMAQNAQRVPWDAERVDTELAERMQAIHDRCVENSSRQNPVDYAEGANVAAFRRLARAKAAQGWG